VPVDCNDLFPTLLDLAGQSPKPYYREIDGRSLAPLFADLTNRHGDYPRTRFFWHYPLNVIVPSPDDGFPLPPHSAIRDGDYKLVFDWSGVLRLYNLAVDPFEKRDLAAAEPRRVRQMFRELNDWIDSRVALKYTPALNPEYRPEQEVRSRPFVDLRRQLLGEKRAIRPAASDPRLR
jgi:arylsulfatase A-like enzyme